MILGLFLAEAASGGSGDSHGWSGDDSNLLTVKWRQRVGIVKVFGSQVGFVASISLILWRDSRNFLEGATHGESRADRN